ncbi:MAG: hypothetical protein KDD53_10750 [Bdellovibrionales bacterium]|nr:hypothetical protein [Bdellovibrionales bacterium]
MKRSRRLIYVTLILLAFAGPLFFIAHSRSIDELNKAKSKLISNNLDESLWHYRRAIGWRTPGQASGLQAVTELLSISDNLDFSESQRELALRMLVSGVKSSRGPVRDILGYLFSNEESLLRIASKAEARLNEENKDLNLIREAFPPGVNFRFQVLAQVMFWGWIFTILSTIYFGFTKEGNLVQPKFKIGVFIGICFYSLWLYSLSQA